MKLVECVFVDTLLRESKDNDRWAVEQATSLNSEQWANTDFPGDGQLTLFDLPY
jgi:hypothetical protein